ncbi:uncharacterized protein LOC127465212 isoform X2 [Manacus candei]|uniref:uncharacterized protein LOC127465212 isoform X2 n=1 Tax=Manacus candei TaxID=415023 RepID=UPI0022277060|nr:uncharacterized protein LOC127465212 isoform X2 [Manacus candei]
MVGRAGLCIAPSGCVELQELLVPPGPMDWTPQPLRSCPATGAVSSGGTASPAGEVGRAFAGLVGHIYSSGMEPGKCTELSPGIERDQAREVKKEGRREVRQQASSTKLLCKQCPSVPAWLFVALQAEEPRPEMAECWCDPQWVSLPSGQSPELPLASPAEGWELPRASSIQLEDPGGCSSCCLGGENLEIGKEEEKPPDSSLSPRQPMNCLAGNGGTGWTLDCSLGMCGSPLRNCRNSWCRLGRWIGRPSPSVPAQPLGPCPVVALPALQVKWEGPFQVLWVTFIAVGCSLETAQS